MKPTAHNVRREKLTARTIQTLSLSEGKREEIVWDIGLPGFGVRLRGKNKTFIIQYRVGKQQRRESLGRKITLEDARNIARKRFAAVELGTDPGAERDRARNAANMVTLTLDSVAARYLDAKKDTLRPNTFKSAKRHFEVHFAPLGNRPIAEIKRAEIAARLQELITEYGRTAAARARSALSSLFSWSMREGLCEINPVAQTNNPGQREARDRVLSDAELAAVWDACLDDDFGRIVRLLILTGCRRDEIGWLQWSEIDGNMIAIPAARSKNRKAHTITLPWLATRILDSIPRRDGRDHLFHGRSGGFASWGHHTRALRARLGDTVGHFTLHDLRRTTATGMAEIGIQPHIIEAVLNHISGHKGGVAGIYNRAAYAEPVRVALQRWADHVSVIIDGRSASNVVNLARIPA
jgi:integrase